MESEQTAKVFPAYIPTETKVLDPADIVYCGICSLPPEFCSYGATADKCLNWLKDNNTALFAKIYPKEAEALLDNSAVAEKLESLKFDEKEAKTEEPKSSKDKKKKAVQKVLVKRVDRNKRKFVTVVSGLEFFDVDLKKAAKQFANKYACGSSVTKNAAGADEIVVQGDFMDDIVTLIPVTWKHITSDLIDTKTEGKK
ncbi:Translation machinery-associated protein 22 [Nowakowskiella sp. JEL0407]|nr:Translation machinery-associated protein 22 [Nowakowskiella sp. JEL0407]